MPSSSSYAWLPIELIENIISQLWSSSLSVDERIIFMTSSALVDKTWSYVFLRVSFKDVHIPCPSYFEQYFRILRKESPIFDDDIKSLPEMLCQSITLTVEHTPTYPALVSDSREPPMGKVLTDLLYDLYFIPYVPNLRTISIEYLNTGYDDIFDNLRFIEFPEQVTDLELTFAFNPRTPQWLVDALRRNQVQHDCLQWSLPSIRRLSIKGGSEAVITDMVSACTEMELLELDLPPEPETKSSETHLVNLLKGVNLEEHGNQSVPPNRLTVTSKMPTIYLAHWEGVQTNFFEDIYQFQRLNSS